MASAQLTAKLINAKGLHARPSSALVTAALTFESVIRVRACGLDVNGKSILELMTLGAPCGTELEFFAEGLDAETAVQTLAGLVTAGFGE